MKLYFEDTYLGDSYLNVSNQDMLDTQVHRKISEGNGTKLGIRLQTDVVVLKGDFRKQSGHL